MWRGKYRRTLMAYLKILAGTGAKNNQRAVVQKTDGKLTNPVPAGSTKSTQHQVSTPANQNRPLKHKVVNNSGAKSNLTKVTDDSAPKANNNNRLGGK